MTGWCELHSKQTQIHEKWKAGLPADNRGFIDLLRKHLTAMCWFYHLQHVYLLLHGTQAGLFHSCLCLFCLTFLALRNPETTGDFFFFLKRNRCPSGIILVSGLHLSDFEIVFLRYTRSYESSYTFTCTTMTCACINVKNAFETDWILCRNPYMSVLPDLFTTLPHPTVTDF